MGVELFYGYFCVENMDVVLYIVCLFYCCNVVFGFVLVDMYMWLWFCCLVFIRLRLVLVKRCVRFCLGCSGVVFMFIVSGFMGVCVFVMVVLSCFIMVSVLVRL